MRKDYLFCARHLCTVIHTYTYEQFLKLTGGLRFRFSFDLGLLFCVFLPLCSRVVCFCCVRFSFFSTVYIGLLTAENVITMTEEFVCFRPWFHVKIKLF